MNACLAPLGSRSNPFPHDPNDELDYQVNWATWLGADTISTSAWTVPSPLTEPTSDANTTTTATVWITGGVPGRKYRIVNRIVTAGGRTKDQSIYLEVAHQ